MLRNQSANPGYKNELRIVTSSAQISADQPREPIDIPEAGKLLWQWYNVHLNMSRPHAIVLPYGTIQLCTHIHVGARFSSYLIACLKKCLFSEPLVSSTVHVGMTQVYVIMLYFLYFC